MDNLSLLGIHTDGEHLVLVDEEGERYLLVINEELRSIVHQQRRKIAAVLAQKSKENMRPKDIQILVRSGATAQEISTSSGLALENVKTYADPVVSERAWIAKRARDTRVSPDRDAPTLGDLVVDRLATRGVSPDTLLWDATRQPGEPWMVHLEFVQDAKNFEANWEFDTEGGVLSALDEQSRWLTENATPAHTDSLLFPREASGLRTNPIEFAQQGDAASASAVSRYAAAPEPDSSATESLLEELNAARGTRLSVVDAGEEDDVSAMEAAIKSGFQETPDVGAPGGAAPAGLAETPETGPIAPVTPMQARGANAPIPVGNSAVSPGSQGVLPGLENLEAKGGKQSESPAPKRSRSSGRAPMPSWEEILFGVKPE